MIKYITVILAVMILVGTSSFGMAAEDTFTCALTKAFECLPDDGCTAWSIDEMALPRFVRIDLKSKTITSLDKVMPRNSKIASIDRLERVIVLHGTEMRGWSIALGEDSNEVTLSASGDGEGFIVFGYCMKN